MPNPLGTKIFLSHHGNGFRPHFSVYCQICFLLLRSVSKSFVSNGFDLERGDRLPYIKVICIFVLLIAFKHNIVSKWAFEKPELHVVQVVSITLSPSVIKQILSGLYQLYFRKDMLVSTH